LSKAFAMGWLDDWLNDLDGLTPALPAAPVTKQAAPRKPPPEINEVWFQTRAPCNGDLGAVERAYYSVMDSAITIHDESGKPTGKEYRLRPGENEKAAAGRLAQEAWRKARGESDFNRPLYYSWLAKT
jgi:hypothetical protein